MKDIKETREVKGTNDVLYGEVISENEEMVYNNKGKHAGETYQYFELDKISKSMNIAPSIRKHGENLVKDGNVELIRVSGHFLDKYEGEPLCYFLFQMKDLKKSHQTITTSLYISKNSVYSSNCNCPRCTSYYYWDNGKGCEYKAAALAAALDYLKNHNVIDATDWDGMFVLKGFAKKKTAQTISDCKQQENALILEPRLVYKDNNMSLSFKIGFDKMFVVKDLTHFAKLVENSDTEVYGSSTNVNHAMQNFNSDSKKWISFIRDCVAEEARLSKTIEQLSWSNKSRKVSSLELYGWRVDRLFELIETAGINFENRDIKKKSIVKGQIKNPKLVMSISPKMEGKIFQGIIATMMFPHMYIGSGRMYFLDAENSILCRVTDKFYNHMSLLLSSEEYNEYGYIKMTVGRNMLPDFYYGVIPEIEPFVDVVEKSPELIEEYLLPETRFSFYLDADSGDASCKVVADYGEHKHSCLDLYNRNKEVESYRLTFKEEEILLTIQQYFPIVNMEQDCLTCGGDEELIYEVVTSGVEELAKLGNVYCTTRFKNNRRIKSSAVSVGVSVSGGMLELDLLTQDLTEEELLDLLKHYKKNSKYYRFKSGEFVDLQDSSLQMLIEMMEAMHLSPKEFVKGKMHLPLYRTLYLDKMLEEHSDVYNTRDQQFRTIIKNMKSVKEADFEVPSALDKVMRNYQKTGFRWMRTLEEYGFGGILADDMGLGKTLQTISVLADAKEKGKTGTSIIVSPASLVYNWGEEFAKFAPNLHVELVAGKQEDRFKIIDGSEKADVLVTSYDLLKRDIDRYEDKEFLYEVIDEAQYIKNQSTAAAKAVKLINSKVKFALTGTPIENRLSELWSIFDYLMPGFLYTYESFKRDYENPIVRYEDEEKMARLQKMVKPFIMRRLKQDVLRDLPEKLEESRIVRFDGEQQKLYDAQVVHMKNELNSSTEEDFKRDKLRILAEITRLRQICCDPHLCYENYNGESAKLDSCIELVENAIEGGHKILLFSQFTSMLAIIEERFSKCGISYFKITGETAKSERINLVKQFNEDDTSVFLISLKAGGVGLNLTGADMVIHYDPWWNVAVQNQATDRAHRIGQTKKVTVFKMIAKGTIEEKILKLQETKKNLADNIINGENVGLGAMSREDIMELLGV